MRRKVEKTVAVLILVASLSGCGQRWELTTTPTESPKAEIVQSDFTPSPQPETVQPTPTPSPEPISAEEPAPQETPQPEITSKSSPETAVGYSGGAIPYNLSEGTNLWWHIDSSDSAYWSVADDINAMRSASGLPELTVDASLSAIADSRCEQIVLSGNFSHDGMCTAAEILGQNYDSAGTVCTAWQNSPSHYAAIVSSDCTRMGIACWFLSLNGQRYSYWAVVME